MLSDDGDDFWENMAAWHESQPQRRVSIADPLEEEAEEAPTKQTRESDPVDLWEKAVPPEFPYGMLPPVIEEFALARAKMMGTDPGGIAMSAITVCSSVITDRIKLKVKRHEKWMESARIWTMLIGDPSYKKSPIMRAAAGKIGQMDVEMLNQYNIARRKWEDMDKAGDPPIPTRLRMEDTTVEAAQEVFRYSPAGVLSLQDELSGWFGAIEKYAGAKGGAKDRSFWLQAYNGGQYAVNRISRSSFIIENLSATILGGVQPDAIRSIVAGATDDGLIQRFIPIVLQPAELGRDEEMPDVTASYESLIETLHEMRAPDSVLGELPLQFDDEAMALREELEAKHHKWVRAIERVNKKLASHLGKYDGLFPRLCIIWHCIEHAGTRALPVEITGDTARRVANFLHGYIFKHSMAFYTGILGLSDKQEILADVAGYILAHEEHDSVTPRIFMRGSSAMKKVPHEDRIRIFDELCHFGWLEPVQRRGEVAAWAVRANVRAFFEDKASEEKERRMETIDIIREMAAGGKW